MKKCSFNDCGRDVKARGWCQTHYMQWRRNGTVTDTRWRAERKSCARHACARESQIYGLCSMHHKERLRRTTPGTIAGSEERFWSYVQKSSGCWVWTGQTSADDYGHFDGWLSHRYAWILSGSEIPANRFLDHKCRVPSCVRPDHLQVVTRKENQENLGLRADNKTGYRGVTFDTAKGLYTASVGHAGAQYYAGAFDTAEQAGSAARDLRMKLHTNNLQDRIHVQA